MFSINLLDPGKRVKFFMLQEGLVTTNPDITKRNGYSPRLICDRLAEGGYLTGEETVENSLLEDVYAGLAIPEQKTIFLGASGPVKETSFAFTPEGAEYYKSIFKLIANIE